MPNGREVVITGVGAVTPLGVGTEMFWNALCQRHSGIGVMPHANGKIGPTDFGAMISDFEPKQYVRPRKALKVMCRELQTAFAAAQMAHAESGFEAFLADNDRYDRSRIGTVFGSEMFYGSPDELADTAKRMSTHQGDQAVVEFGSFAMRELFPLWMLKYLPNMAACHVGIAVQAFGPNNTLVLGDTSGPAALVESASCIRRGIADAVFTGASGTRINESGFIYSGACPLASPREPLTDSSRPFSPDRDGVVGGEGAAALLLEERDFANKRGATPIARLAGSAVRFVPASASQRGSRRAIELALSAALEQAGIAAQDIGLVVSHAMGDPQQDEAEMEALLAVLPKTPLCAPIASTAHCGAATGSMHLVTAVLALRHQTIPPLRHAESLGEDFPLDVSASPRALKHPAVVVLTHTPQGHATAIVLTAA
ncbi:beta-ketoacyl-[acyl-carrier-protein] synthase family protein [Roseimaritima sediminicola]|uniref:beta-ketoacyl-[acyl-carrier-protein] synthase family protein n=1 Tax=Roseimaritima sediminicola TaxID=2662066 RepID=UPI0012985853|nr:beta-ketoacyl synthase N-terminal-like domain-containing protein [Roseimaritima sediminicola]